MLKILFSQVILLISLVSCASFKTSHSCDWSFKINDGNYQACRSHKSKRFVLYDVDNDKILSEDSFEINWFLKPGIVLAIFKDYIEKFSGKNLSKKEIIKTKPWGKFQIGGQGKFATGQTYNLINLENGISIFNSETGTLSKGKITKWNNDQNHKTEHGDLIPNFLMYAFGDVLVRSDAWINRRHIYQYQLYDKNAQPQLKREVLSSATSLYRNNGRYLLFKDVDPDMNIVRPIVAGIEQDFLEAKNIEGIILLDEKTWKLKKQSNKLATLPSFKNFIIVTNDNGRRSYYESSYLIDHTKSRIEQLKAFKQALIPPRGNQTAKFSDLERITYVYKDKNGILYEQERPLLKNYKNKYVTADRYGNLNQYFSSKNEFQNKVAVLRKNYKDYIADMKERERREKAYRESRRKLDKAIADQQAREERMRRENRERDARAMRAAKDAAWSGVADKIQNAGRASKSKADCIRKRTQTKKDFLDKKQGWYQTGGC